MLSAEAMSAMEALAPSDVNLDGVRVLVFGINYWPEPTGIAPYTTELAEYMAAQGAQVKVLTGVPHYPNWRVSTPYNRGLVSRERHRGVEIVRLRHSVPRKMNTWRRTMYEATFYAHVAMRSSDEEPDLIVSATPAIGGAVAASKVAHRTQRPSIVHVQDLMAKAASQSGMTGASKVTSMASRIEGRVLRAADRVMLVSESFREAVVDYGVDDRRISILQNWTRITASSLNRHQARVRLGWPTDRFLAVHTGNMGFKQDLGNVLNAAKRLVGSNIDFVLVGDGSQRHQLEKMGADLPNVRFIGLVDDELYPDVLAAADVLLVNERPSVEEMSMPSKITSYVAAGRPIVAAVGKGSASYRYLQTTNGAAMTVDPGQPEILAAALTNLVGRDLVLRDMGNKAKAYSACHLEREPTLTTFGVAATGLVNANRKSSQVVGNVESIHPLELQHG